MSPPRLRTLLAPLALLMPFSALHAAVNISDPAVPDPFTAVPPVTSWSTLSVGAGTDTAITTVAQFDAKIIAAASAATVITTLTSSPTFAATTGPSANIIARFNTGEQTTPVGITFLQTRPTTNDYILLMATLSNGTGADLGAVKVAYDYSKFTETGAATELIKSLRAFWSVTGTPGSWQLIPDLSVDTTGLIATPQPVTTNIILGTPLPAAGTMYILWADQNSSSTDSSYHIKNFAASPGINCVITGSPITPVRHPGADPASPADDTVTFSTTITGTGNLGPGWRITAGPMLGTTGNYGDPVNFNLTMGEFTGSSVTLKFEDQSTAQCFFETTVTAPHFIHAVTATSSPTITFSPAAVGDGAYAPPLTTLTEPGWSGGNTSAATNVSNVQTQPPPSPEILKYFHMTTNGTSLITDPVDVNALKGSFLKGEVELSLYTTSGSGLDAGDAINSRIEVAQDGDFSNTAAGNILTMNIKDVPATSDAAAFGATIAAANPYMNFGTAAGQNPFPSTDFTFYKFAASTQIPATASNPHARIIVQSITGITNTEHLLIDNIAFKPNTEPTLEAAIAGAVIWNNNGTVITTDDFFTVPVNVFSFNLGASPGWNSNETPVRSGLYTDANPVLFGPYPSRTPVNVQLSDQTNPAVTSAALTLSAPITLTLTPGPNAVIRNLNGPGDADDSATFELMISGTNGGPEFRMNSYPTVATTPSLALTPVPVNITVTLSPIPTQGTLLVIFQDASYPATSGGILVPIPTTGATQYIIGQKDVGGGLTDVVTDAALPLAPQWMNFPGIRTLEMTNGAGAPAKVVTSERIDLTGVSGNVNFSARLRAIDLSAGFEAADTFLAELILDDDTDNPVNLITAYDTFAPANGLMNGGGTAAEDEFNIAQAGDGSYLSDFNLSYVIPDNVNSVRLVITAVNDSNNETFVVENVLFSVSAGSGDADGDGVSDVDEETMGTNPNDPADVLRLSQNPGNPSQIDFPTKNGRFYRVYASDDADENSHLAKWKDSQLATFVGNGSTASFNITVAPGEARRFYRLHVMTTDGITGIGDWPATVP